MLSYVVGTLTLLRVWAQQVAVVYSLPGWLRSPDDLHNTLVAKGLTAQRFQLSLSRAAAVAFNDRINGAKRVLRGLHKSGAVQNEAHDVAGSAAGGLGYRTQLVLLYAVRLAMVVTAWHNRLDLTLAVSLLQLLVAPYSLFASVGLMAALAPPIYLSHYVSALLLRSAAPAALAAVDVVAGPEAASTVTTLHDQWLMVPITGHFLLAFFVTDQAACAYCHWCTPTVAFTRAKTAKHVAWGFLNCKTFYLVLLVHLWSAGASYSLLAWAADWALGLTPRLANAFSALFMHWTALFYTAHRMAHLPKVYDHAHKLHHYITGTTAFDAHIYGNGMPEEFCMLLLELCAALRFGLLPASLNRWILYLSWTNKQGHTQQPEDTHGNNHHTDHHLRHLRNFGIYNCLLDMYFGTNTNNDRYAVVTHNVSFPGFLPAPPSDVDPAAQAKAAKDGFTVFDVTREVSAAGSGPNADTGGGGGLGAGTVTFTFTRRD